MRGIALTIGALPLAGLLALAVPATADAATGKLVINGRYHHQPSGCYGAYGRPLHIRNWTNQRVYVYQGRHCDGELHFIIHPRSHRTVWHGNSIYVR